MMINKRLIGTVAESRKYIAGNVVLQWCSLAANIAMMFSITNLFAGLYYGNTSSHTLWATAAVVVLALVIRFLCTTGASRMSYLSSKAVKKTLREKIYEKLLRLGASYNEQVKTSEVVQVAVEGVDQLETYFGAYLPQFFYAMLAPLTLFAVLCFVNVPAAIVLLICVPLIPIAIAAVQTWAKKLLSKYWGQYTALGDTFLENLQGLTTLKIYQADEFKNKEMNVEAEKFRKITMKVLTMQLNSITIMDLIAYGGAALGVIMAVTQYMGNHVSLAGCLLIILLAADFFLPMRQLGSFFHIAMNGMAASDKIFRLLDLPEHKQEVSESFPSQHDIACSGLRFSYEPDREILHGVDLQFPQGSFTALVGEGGCGKSTIGKMLVDLYTPTEGQILYNGVDLTKLPHKERRKYCKDIQLIFQDPYASLDPRMTVADIVGEPLDIYHLCEGKERQERIYELLNTVGLGKEHASRYPHEFSGGQRQRVGLARALVLQPELGICDEPISALDVSLPAQVINLLKDFQEERGVSYLFIAHDLSMVP